MTSLKTQSAPDTEKHLSHPKYRPDIDGMRAIAVGAVVLFHAFPTLLPGGFTGVDIFFVISGYLISTILMKSAEQGTFSIGEFYARRVNRIFPALFIVMLCSYIFGWLALFTNEFEQLGKHIAGGAGFVANLVLFNESGYFDTVAETKPFLHLWSLGIEEQFYIVWPLVIWAAWRRKFNLLAIAVLLLLASFTANIMNVRASQAFTFYMPHTRAWELLIGSILAYLHCFPSQRFKPSATLAHLMSLLGLGLIAYGLATISKNDLFPGWVALYPTLGAVLIIGAGPAALVNRYLLSNRVFVWIGLISFPLYLWHWPLLTFARILENGLPSPEVRSALVAAAVVLSWLTYQLVEKPIRKSRTRTSITALAVAMALIGSAGFLTYYYKGLPWRASILKTVEVQDQFVGPIWKYATNELCINRYPLDERKDYSYWFCMTNKDAPPSLLVYGSSYANHLYPGLAGNKAFANNTILNIGACGVGSPDYADRSITGGTNPCTGLRPQHQEDQIFDIVEKSASVKYAIIDGLLDTQLSDFYIALVEKRIARLLDNNVKVIVFIPHLTFDVDIRGCFTRPLVSGNTEGCTLPIARKKALDERFQPLVDAVQAKYPQVQFFDQNKMICDANSCSMVLDGMPVFRDQFYHYSEFASARLSQMFSEWAKEHAPDIFNP
ncbi:MAG: acyltransferase [Paucimonas sp.]|jgi:peptidoglycan/LPS O-acetylase OafA/YrhL|nr:acyltransferase [Paucimonas sp.]